MRVLVACEWSGTVRDAFLRRGHDAWSCDIERAEHPNPNWRRHIRGDVRPLLKERWDLVIAHPPCTYLCKGSVCRINEPGRVDGMFHGAAFFKECLNANALMVCVENPRPHLRAGELIGEPTQIVEPYQFGHPFTKATGLWLRGLPKLKPTVIVEPTGCWVYGGNKNGSGSPRKKLGVNRDSMMSARTFTGIARAMAEQWG